MTASGEGSNEGAGLLNLLLRKERADAVEETMRTIEYLACYHRVHAEEEGEEGLSRGFHERAVAALAMIERLFSEASELALAHILSEPPSKPTNERTQVAGRNNKNPAPRCSGELKDGSPCRTAAKKGEALCEYHLRLASEEAEAPVVEEEATKADAVVHDDGDLQGVSAPQRPPDERPKRDKVENLRVQLAADSLEAYDVIQGSLLGALGAEKDSWVNCPHCKKRHTVSFPDWTARTTAIKTLLEQGFGKPSEQKKTDADYETFMRSIREMSDEELEAWMTKASNEELWMAAEQPKDAKELFAAPKSGNESTHELSE